MIKRYLVLISALFIVAIITHFFSSKIPTQQNALYANQLPVFLNGWRGKDIEVGDNTRKILETDDVLLREYKKEGLLPIQFCVVYASNNRKVSHPPEICYSGDGWSLEEKEPILFSIKSDEYPEFQAMKLIIEKGEKKQLVLYWYKCNKQYANNYYKQQINIVKSGLIRGSSSSGMIRVSTSFNNNEESDVMMRLQQFSLNMLPFVTKYLP